MDQEEIDSCPPILPEALEELKKIYYSEFGKPLSDAGAQEMGERLVRLFEIIYHPFPKEKPLKHQCSYQH